MLVILEGPDGSGKTTLSKQLKKKGYEVLCITRGNNITYDYMLRLALDRKIYVLDRAIVTPWVYRLLDKEPRDVDDFNWEQVFTLLTISKFVYCKTDIDYETSIARGEDNVTTKEKANRLKQLYEFVFDTIKLYNMSTVITYDWTNDKLNKILRFIGE